jgi:hypothetical protein
MNTQTRTRFEAAAYKQYETAYMVNALQNTKSVSAKFEKSDFTRRDKDGGYVVELCAMLWVGYQLCVADLSDTIEQADLWNQWCAVLNKAEKNLPENYEIALVSEGPASDGDGRTSIMLMYYGKPSEPELVQVDSIEDTGKPNFPMRKYAAAIETSRQHQNVRLN